MALFDDIRAYGASFRLTEEALYAEALREIEAGIRRDGLWAKALVESNGDENLAKTIYIKLRVRSLRDEATLYIREVRRQKPEDPKQEETQIFLDIEKDRPSWREKGRKALNVFMIFGLILWIGIMLTGGIMSLIT